MMGKNEEFRGRDTPVGGHSSFDILHNEKITLDLLLHGNRVAELSALIAAELGLGEEGCMDVMRAANVHDIGKIYIPEAILNKPGKLTQEEFRVIRQHPVHSFNVARQVDYLKKYAKIVLLHHECYDGSGYFGIKGEQIPLPSRIITIADCFDALTNDRPYRQPFTAKAAIKEMMKEAKHGKYDPVIFAVFLKIIGERMRQAAS